MMSYLQSVLVKVPGNKYNIELYRAIGLSCGKRREEVNHTVLTHTSIELLIHFGAKESVTRVKMQL